jgi:hypothetical protein
MSGPNRSTAVMQRRVEAPDSLDDYPTPPWATRALCEFLIGQGIDISQQSVLEPACNRGHMAKPLAEYFASVDASDIHDYGYGAVRDFLPQPMFMREAGRRVDWIITNPPFNLAADFAREANRRAKVGVALIVRSAWLESEERYRELFSQSAMRPTFWLQFVERVLMLRGRLVKNSAIDPATGKTVTTATAYSWAIWIKGDRDDWMRAGWIAPCRKRLERPGDYPTYPAGYFGEAA